MKFSGLIELILPPLLWAAAIFAAMQLQHVVVGGQHSICGPWGCGPPLGALVAMHVGWLAVLAPPLLYLPFRTKISRASISRLAAVLIAAGLIGIVAISAWQWLVWLPQSGQWSRDYIWQRCGFAIASAVDFPMVQTFAIGLVLTLSNAIGILHGAAEKHQPMSSHFPPETNPQG